MVLSRNIQRDGTEQAKRGSLLTNQRTAQLARGFSFRWRARSLFMGIAAVSRHIVVMLSTHARTHNGTRVVWPCLLCASLRASKIQCEDGQQRPE